MNCFNKQDYEIFSLVLKELNLTNKTKKFWNYLFDNILVKPHIAMEYALNSDYSKAKIYKKQFELAKKYGEDIDRFSYKEMAKEIIREDLSDFNNVDDLFNNFSKDIIGEVLKETNKITRLNDLKSDKLAEKLIKYFDINELYKLNFSNEKLIKEHIKEFDKELFFELGFKNLSTDFIEKYISNIDLKNISDIEPEDRENIGVNKFPLYENGGCSITKRYYNGLDIYIPYGIANNIFNAIELSIRCMDNQIDLLNESIKSIKSMENIDDLAKEKIISSREYDIENIKKNKLLLDSFIGINYDI